MARQAQHPAPGVARLDPIQVDLAYRRCDVITALHSRSFHLATQLLPADKRRAIRALYAFCRTVDDLVDRPDGRDVASRLAAWREVVRTHVPLLNDPISPAWVDASLRYRIPTRYAEQLIDGVSRDLTQTRYNTFDDLAAYAYGVASTVGLMSMHVTGSAGPEAIPYAIRMGVALQLTNILRDVGEDWRAGRLYLPLDELSTYGLGEADIARGQVDERWRTFMRFQIARTRRLYAEARPGIALLSADSRQAVAAACTLYGAILDDVEAHDYDVFSRRAHVGMLSKIARLPGIWWDSQPWG